MYFDRHLSVCMCVCVCMCVFSCEFVMRAVSEGGEGEEELSGDAIHYEPFSDALAQVSLALLGTHIKDDIPVRIRMCSCCECRACPSSDSCASCCSFVPLYYCLAFSCERFFGISDVHKAASSFPVVPPFIMFRFTQFHGLRSLHTALSPRFQDKSNGDAMTLESEAFFMGITTV
jgi:hypothetical protein